MAHDASMEIDGFNITSSFGARVCRKVFIGPDQRAMG